MMPPRKGAVCYAYSFILPGSFQPGEFIRDPWLWDDARYFIGLILTKFARRQVDKRDAVLLQAKFLRAIMNKHKYHGVVDALLAGGAVKRFPYSAGRSFSYKLAERYIHDQHVRVPVTCPRLASRLKVFHESDAATRCGRMKPVHRHLEQRQHGLRIDGGLAREILRDMPESNPFDCQGILVRDIEERRYRFNVGRYGRVANSITNLKRQVRSALRVDDARLDGVDIVAAQPSLLGLLLHRQRKEQEQAEPRQKEGERGEGIYDAPHLPLYRGDVQRYLELVQSGTLYETLLAELRRRGVEITRETLKHKLLRDVIAKKKAGRGSFEYPSLIEGVFSELFPTVYLFVRWYNRDGWEHQNLIRELQRQEAGLVIERVAGELVTKHPRDFFITVHDSIYTTPGKAEKVRRAFEKEFDRMGFAMRLKPV
jgi:hypothetical protein